MTSLEDLRPGLHWWSVRHPEWTEEESGPNGWEPEVASYLYESPGALVLFDPLVVNGWDELDMPVADRGAPHVLLTIFWHARSAQALFDRYPGTTVWIHETMADAARERVTVTHAYRPTDRLPGGVEVRIVRGGETVYWIPEHRALVTGDALLGTPDGGIRLMPESWLGELSRADYIASLRPLTELPVELVLLTHGGPVRDGQRKLREAIG